MKTIVSPLRLPNQEPLTARPVDRDVPDQAVEPGPVHSITPDIAAAPTTGRSIPAGWTGKTLLVPPSVYAKYLTREARGYLWVTPTRHRGSIGISAIGTGLVRHTMNLWHVAGPYNLDALHGLTADAIAEIGWSRTELRRLPRWNNFYVWLLDELQPLPARYPTTRPPRGILATAWLPDTASAADSSVC